MNSPSYGQIAGACLLLSLATGFIVAYQYEAAAPFISTTAMEAVLPFGWFWRSLHFWTSQGFLLMLCLHAFDTCKGMDTLGKKRPMRIHWTIISFVLPLAVLALFSGYVLRFDGTGQAAGAIAEHLLLDVPWIGNGLNRLFMAVSTEGLNRLYAVHILAGCLCWLLGTWYHTRTVRINFAAFSISTVFFLLFCLFIHAPIDLPQGHLHLIRGPWFFLGVQELLRHFDPVSAGIIFPLIPVLTVAVLPWLKKRDGAYLVLLLWTFAYAGITLVGVLRTG